ncbi:hypothetical protein PINS_up018595 [Pythium insidiosum]|nr:hypothetical protein PINS_up018595 [Pythium insidiosum]
MSSGDEKPVEQTTAQDAHAPDATTASTPTSRVRRTTQKFGFEEKQDDEEEEFKPPVGSGVKVKDMEVVSEKISRMGKKDAETLKSLYNIMYSRRFQLKNLRSIKEHILEFSGIPNGDDKVRQQLVQKIGRWMRAYLQDIMDVLGVDRSKKSFDEQNKTLDKEGLIHRLIDWLFNPHESAGAKRKSSAAATKKKSPKAASKTTAGSKRKAADKSKAPAKKAKTATKKAKPAPVEKEEDAEEEETESEQEDEGEDSSSDFDEPTKTKKTARKPRAKKSRQIDSEDEEGDVAESEEVTGGADDDVSMSTSGLDAETKAKVKDIIANGDAQELTVKTIVRQLSSELGKDLSSQKSAIKEFIKQL